MPRSIVIDGACSRAVTATIGVTAASGHATDQLLCLMLDVCNALVDGSATVTLTLFVDDIVLEHEGGSDAVADDHAQSIALAVNLLQEGLGLEVSPITSVAIASTATFAKRVKLVVAKTSKFCILVVPKVQMFGAGSGAGVRRCSSVLKSRTDAVSAKKAYFATFTKNGG